MGLLTLSLNILNTWYIKFKRLLKIFFIIFFNIKINYLFLNINF
jgi:hypothetical protein